jgi:hypothetical protein
LDASIAEVLATSSVDVPNTSTISTLISQPIVSNASSNAASISAAGGAIQRQTAKGVTVELLACNNTSAGLRCDLSFINRDRDKGVGAFSASAFDARGGQYEFNEGQMGNGQALNRSLTGVRLEARLITGVATAALILFEQISQTIH